MVTHKFWNGHGVLALPATSTSWPPPTRTYHPDHLVFGGPLSLRNVIQCVWSVCVTPQHLPLDAVCRVCGKSTRIWGIYLAPKRPASPYAKARVIKINNICSHVCFVYLVSVSGSGLVDQPAGPLTTNHRIPKIDGNFHIVIKCNMNRGFHYKM